MRRLGAFALLAVLGCAGCSSARPETGAPGGPTVALPGEIALPLPGGVTMDFRLIPASTNGEASFHAGVFEVTQTQWTAVMGWNPSYFPEPQNPVEEISWGDAREFCRRVTTHGRRLGALDKRHAVALPTERQWLAFVGDARLADAVCSVEIIRRGPEPVGTRGANRLGLHDTLGNVWEWCCETYAPGSTARVLHGGAWGVSNAELMAPAFRYASEPDATCSCTGFRCVIVAVGGTRRADHISGRRR